MKYAFLVSGIVEILGGFVFYFYPELMFGIDLTGVHKLYGLAALVIGSVCIFSFQHYENNRFFKKVFLVFMGFHAALAMLCFGMPISILTLKIEATLTHLLCFVVFFTTYMKDVKPEKKS